MFVKCDSDNIVYVKIDNDIEYITKFENNIPEDFNWDEIQAYSEKMNGNFYCALSDLSLVSECI